MVQKYIQLFYSHPRIQWRENRTDSGTGKQDLKNFRGVIAQISNAIPFFDTKFLLQTSGEARNLRLHTRISNVAFSEPNRPFFRDQVCVIRNPGRYIYTLSSAINSVPCRKSHPPSNILIVLFMTRS